MVHVWSPVTIWFVHHLLSPIWQLCTDTETYNNHSNTMPHLYTNKNNNSNDNNNTQHRYEIIYSNNNKHNTSPVRTAMTTTMRSYPHGMYDPNLWYQTQAYFTGCMAWTQATPAPKKHQVEKKTWTVSFGVIVRCTSSEWDGCGCPSYLDCLIAAVPCLFYFNSRQRMLTLNYISTYTRSFIAFR